MLDNNAFQELSRRLSALLPAAEGMREELRTKIEQTLKKGFAELNLLTQEDFQAQVVSLQRAQQRIDELEGEIRRLEEKVNSMDSGS